MTTIAIIGHGKTPVRRRWGSKIDACDVVVRLWDNQWQDAIDYGTKYTYGYFELSPKQWRRFELSRLELEIRTPALGWVAGLLKTTTVDLPPNTKVISMGRWITLGQELGGVGNTGKLKLTRGCAVAAWALETFQGEVTLVGFDNIYVGLALPPEEAFPEVYLQTPTTAALKGYVGGGTKYHNHDYIAEGDLLWSLARKNKVSIAHAQQVWE